MVKAHYICSPIYVDALIVRDRDFDGNSGNGLEERTWLTQDANFNVTGLINSAGTFAERYAYDAYGTVSYYDANWATRTSSNWQQLYQHQGLRLDVGVGKYHARNRDYDPAQGRWMTEDPLGFGANDANWYRGLGNNPGNFTDSSGLDPETLARAIERRQLEEAGKRQEETSKKRKDDTVKPPRAEYYSDFGWVDWSHANTSEAKVIIDAVNAEKSYPPFLGRKVPKGYYRMLLSVGNYPSIALRYYYVKCGLDERTKLRVAYSIYKNLVTEHEILQAWANRSGLTSSKSGFSAEDVPSNMLGFHMAANGWTRKNMEPMLGKKLDPKNADQLEGLIGGLGKRKNTTTEPVNFNDLVKDKIDKSWPTKMKWRGRVGLFLEPIVPEKGGIWYYDS